MVHIFHTHFDTEKPDGRCPGLIREMPPSVVEKISRYLRWQDRQSALYGRLLLVAGLRLFDPGFSCDSLERLAFNAQGRPFLEGGPDFNISHSGGCVVCAVSGEGRVGIDVERIRDIEVADFAKYLPEVRQPCSPEGLKSFYDCWTMKESALKADGRGMSLGLEAVKLEGKTALVEGAVWFLKEVCVTDGYSCHVAVPFEEAEVRLTAVYEH